MLGHVFMSTSVLFKFYLHMAPSFIIQSNIKYLVVAYTGLHFAVNQHNVSC